MQDKADENADWKSKYQKLLKEIEAQEFEWTQIETLLRKAIGRLTIAGQGVDAKLDQHLSIVRELSREKQNEKLELALDDLTEIVAALDDKADASNFRRSDPIMLMLELLQNIRFDTAQRVQLKNICSELLISVAKGHDKDSVSIYIQKLSTLINENFDNLDADVKSANIVYRLVDLLQLDEACKQQIHTEFCQSQGFQEGELESLADLINLQLDSDDDTSSIDEVITTLLERLAIVQGTEGEARELQSRIHPGANKQQWVETLNLVVNSVSSSLQKLEKEKRELESFIVKVTDQLGEITHVISADHEDHQSDHQDAQSLHDFVQEGMSLMQKNFQATTDLQELKQEISKNIDVIRGGVDDFAHRFNERHEATEERNVILSQQLSLMEQETQELQDMLNENRTKLLYDALTGVYSRMAYDERILQELSRWARYETPFSYVILDIDHFKRINDTFGHNAGDKALKLVAQMMQKHVRQSDHVFRIGGEEFVLMLPSTNAENAAVAVDKMRQGIAASSFHFKGKPVQLTLSAGITETRNGDTVEAIYERADKALYKAKNAGRNCQFIAD